MNAQPSATKDQENSMNTPEQQAAERAAIIESNKQKTLQYIHENLRKLRYDQRVRLIERFHENIVAHAKDIRMRASIQNLHAQSIENQVAKQRNAIKYEGMWVQTYGGDIPVLIVETIETMKKDVKWAKDRP